jgi:hypothetical protein
MARFQAESVPSSLLAFGRCVSARDAFDELVETRGWQKETWQPTFVEECERGDDVQGPPRDGPGEGWPSKQVLRPRRSATERPPAVPAAADPRIMVASAAGLPSLYYVEWHYIDFVLSCVGNVSEAARVLGVRRSTLQRKRKKMRPNR